MRESNITSLMTPLVSPPHRVYLRNRTNANAAPVDSVKALDSQDFFEALRVLFRSRRHEMREFGKVGRGLKVFRFAVDPSVLATPVQFYETCDTCHGRRDIYVYARRGVTLIGLRDDVALQLKQSGAARIVPERRRKKYRARAGAGEQKRERTNARHTADPPRYASGYSR